MKVVLVGGARPNFMKIAPLLVEMKKYPGVRVVLVHTGQHYDDRMSKVFFRDLGLPEPDIFLGAGPGSHAGQTAKIMTAFEEVCLKEAPDMVVLVGDVNSTLACSIAAAKIDYGSRKKSMAGKRPAIVHVEAGLRSFDRTMPEEINRIVTDSLSDLLFTTCRDADANLMREGVPREKICCAGNVMADTLLRFKGIAEKKAGIKTGTAHYALLTLHRPANVDNRQVFGKMVAGLDKVSKYIPIIFPCHPRTQKQIRFFGLGKNFKPLALDRKGVMRPSYSINITEPVSYLDFLHLMAHAKFVLTDSGGIQEETTVLGVPCLTLRENTERPITVTEGTNLLIGADPKKILRHSLAILRTGGKKGRVPPLWDGRAAERIVRFLVKAYGNKKRTQK